MAGNINMHPAPNRALGELMPGWFDVPQNPITASQWGVARTATLGEIMAASFVVPQNPLVGFASGNVQALAVQPGKQGTINGSPVGGVSGMGCGCGGSCGGCGGGMSGISDDLSVFIGDLTAGNLNTALFTDTIAGFPAWSAVAAAGVAFWFMFSGTGKSRAGRAYSTVRRKLAA